MNDFHIFYCWYIYSYYFSELLFLHFGRLVTIISMVLFLFFQKFINISYIDGELSKKDTLRNHSPSVQN